MRCPLCNDRRSKRHCPALGKDICAVCCATKRVVEIACPPTCGYLTLATSHPSAAVKRQEERDRAHLMQALQGLSDRQSELLWLVFSLLAHYRPDGFAAAKDVDIVDGVSALVATYETARRGVIYEHRPDTLPGQRIMSELTGLFGEAAKNAGRPIDGDASLALERTKRLAESVRQASPGHETAFLDFLKRVATPAAEPGRGAGHSPIIVP